MKPIKTKAQTREEINRQIEDFLQTGGEVKAVQRGVSGRELGQNLALPMTMERSNTSRTPVNDEVAAIEARRKAKAPAPLKPRSKKPERKLIVDDFGEPVRWVWVDPNNP